MRTRVNLNLGKKGGALMGINLEDKDAIRQLFESNGWPGNVQATDVCGTESTALSTSLDKPCPFVLKLSLLQLIKAFES